jgi:Flp pilus assembly pilin Flp
MLSIVNLINRLKSDESGASMIEYTVLLAILLVAVIAIIAASGSALNRPHSYRTLGMPAH